MKTVLTLLRTLPALVVCCVSLHTSAQLNNGGFHANFGVDADTKADYIKYGPRTGAVQSEDWFSTGGSRGVIDTANAFLYRSLLMQNKNISFTQRMAAPLYFKSSNSMWIDAVYSRDYLKIDTLNLDTTAFTMACKNAADPALWQGGPAGVSNKNDIMDVYTHMRRNGYNINDSLWLFTAASMVGTTGSKYYDVELFRNNVSFNPATGAFTTAGPDEGHSQWIFDRNGNIVQTGDLIIAITYNPGAAPVIDVRIWVSRNTYNTVRPAFFSFSTAFDANANNSVYGYASIISKNGSTAFGSGAGNYTATGNDTTYSTPWGTTSRGWQQEYDALQLVEVGINLTRIGIDPALYGTLGSAACGSFFKSILYKSRSSASFSSNLNDFVGPLDFMRIPVMDYRVVTDTLSCRKTMGTLQVHPGTTAGYYSWTTPDGAITGTAADGSLLAVSKNGTYVVQGSVAGGCATGRTDTVQVLIDTFPPKATATATINIFSQAQLIGGDPVASNYPTRFGSSRGLLWNWTSPIGFQSSLQHPIITVSNTYTLTVTELRNGCISTATVHASFWILPDNNMDLKGTVKNNSAQLQWKQSAPDAVSYEVEKSIPGKGFTSIARMPAASVAHLFAFADRNLHPGWNQYRIREVTQTGAVHYSNLVQLAPDPTAQYQIVRDGQQGTWYLVADAGRAGPVQMAVMNSAGAVLATHTLYLSKGINRLPVSMPRQKGTAGVAILYRNSQTLFTQKIIF